MKSSKIVFSRSLIPIMDWFQINCSFANSLSVCLLLQCLRRSRSPCQVLTRWTLLHSVNWITIQLATKIQQVYAQDVLQPAGGDDQQGEGGEEEEEQGERVELRRLRGVPVRGGKSWTHGLQVGTKYHARKSSILLSSIYSHIDCLQSFQDVPGSVKSDGARESRQRRLKKVLSCKTKSTT